MEMEQILKQVEWLDDERRKDKTRLGALEEKLKALESQVSPLEIQSKDLSSEVTRFNHLDNPVGQLRRIPAADAHRDKTTDRRAGKAQRNVKKKLTNCTVLRRVLWRTR